MRFNNPEGSISENDKQEIYKALYSLNSEVANLKKIIASGSYVQNPVISQHNAISEPNGYVSHPNTNWSGDNNIDIQDNAEHDKSSAGHSVEVKKNIVVSVEPSLSLKDTQEDLIRKALEKHDGNRKKAAEELGISERTLYRRIPDDYKTKR